MSDIDLGKFIDRENETGLVINRVSDILNGMPFAPEERVFHFVGPSGIGKSSLLQKIYSLLTKKQYVVPILVRLDALQDAKQGFAVEFLKTVYEGFCKYSGIVTNPVLKEPSISISKYALMVGRAISLRKNSFPVLLLDEINVPFQIDLREIEELVLVKLLHENSRTVLITASRSQFTRFNDIALRPSPSNTFILPVFDQEKTNMQMEALKPGSGALAEKVIKLGNGVPRNTVKLVEHLSGDQLEIPNEVQAIQWLLDDIKKKNEIEKRFYPMLEALSILQGFFPEDVAPLFQSHPQLENEWDDGKVKEVFLELSRIQVGPGGLVDWDRDKKHWAMDESTRNLFERELQMREPELWRKLHCTAFEMYLEWGENYKSDMYQKKSAYHMQCLQSAGMNCE